MNANSLPTPLLITSSNFVEPNLKPVDHNHDELIADHVPNELVCLEQWLQLVESLYDQESPDFQLVVEIIAGSRRFFTQLVHMCYPNEARRQLRSSQSYRVRLQGSTKKPHFVLVVTRPR